MTQISIYQTKANNTLEQLQIETLSPESTGTLKHIADKTESDFIFIQIKPGTLAPEFKMMSDWLNIVRHNETIFGYSDYMEVETPTNPETYIPTIDYQTGSIRDDFNFGALVVIKAYELRQFINQSYDDWNYAGLYAFRLWVSRKQLPARYPKACYRYAEPDLRASGKKQFDYVDPRNRERQIEMEQVATRHLETIGAKVSPPFEEANFGEQEFENEASVIIPLLNREKTITDAIDSVLKQETNFRFNLIIVNNHSTDRTGEIIDRFNDKRIVHHVPQSSTHGIGGCWNEGINHPECGRFAIQLDSDDLYLNEHTLQKIVDKFHEEKCAMVIGSYRMVDFGLNELPPGVIDHREWTAENGPNNALRINGLGAPRAFFTPVVRKIGFPNVSYGEDYAVGLAISRNYKIGRIYEPVYLCRRWGENTDSNLAIEKINEHNTYKDWLRSNEIAKRKEYFT
ncbi:MAG: glycosyltransferase family 2 protein [Prolixibacteraceae bacterium]|nr:glycosyltransferase family 2 protein [Prolixibacteraceae bacterium]